MRKFGHVCAAIAAFALVGRGYAQMGWQFQAAQQMYNQSMRQAAEFQRQQLQQLQQLQQQLAQQAQAQRTAAENEANNLHVITRAEFNQLLDKANDGAALAQTEDNLLKYIGFVCYRVFSATQSQEKAIDKINPMMAMVPEVEKKAKTLGADEYSAFIQARQKLAEQNAQAAQRSSQLNQMIMQDLMNGISRSNEQITQSMQSMQNVTYPTVRSSASSYKRTCTIHGQEYDIRYGSGCALCRQPDYGGGKTSTMRCGVHGYWFDPAIGCPGCKNTTR